MAVHPETIAARKRIVASLKVILRDMETLSETDMGWLPIRVAARFHSITDQFRTLTYDIEG